MLLIIGSCQKTTVILSTILKHVKWTEYIGKMSVDRQILMLSEIRFNILFRTAGVRYSDILDGHEHRKEDQIY